MQPSAAALSVYAPQQASDQDTLNATLASTQQSLANQTTDVGTSYDNSMTAAGTKEQTQGDTAQFDASKAGLYGSGIMANGVNTVVGNYDTAVGELATDRNNKLTDIAQEGALAQTTFDSESGALASKYQGLEEQYDTSNDQYNAEIAKENQVLAAYETAGSGSSSSGGGSSASSSSGSSSSGSSSSPSSKSSSPSTSKTVASINKAVGAGNPGVIL